MTVATAEEIARAIATRNDITEAIRRRIESGDGTSHHDVVSALGNLLVHHAKRAEMGQIELLSYVHDLWEMT